jgi:hypothetical protein
MHAHIYTMQKWRFKSNFNVPPPPPPKPELGKVWHGLNKNQGVATEHDEQYQMSTRT